MGDIITLETPLEQRASDDLSYISKVAIEGSKRAQNFLQKIWLGESWESIKEKLETEGSVWYVWWMEGVRNHLTKEYESDNNK